MAENEGKELELAITVAALEALETEGVVRRERLLEQFPGSSELIDSVLVALGVYEARVGEDRSAASVGSRELLNPGARLGEFEIQGELGRGGMGVVYRARQDSLGGREVALKVLPPALVAKDPRFLERFRREAALAAGVHDPHVAEVFGFGEENGLVFFAMQLVEGQPMDGVLKALARERRLGSSRYQAREYVRDVVTLVRTLASGVGALHARGLVHRDIKPSNVILAGLDDTDPATLFEALREAQPVLIDFGLMRPVAESEMTGSQTMLGTTGFASPEARLGRKVDERADVFALGAILHDLLALTSPGDRDPATAGLSDVRTLNPAVDARLAAIVRMALDERPELRYSDARALARELDSYTQGRAIAALPTTPWHRLRLWVRRDTGHALSVIMGLGAAFVALLALTWGIAATVGARNVGREIQRLTERGELAAAADALHDVASHRTILEWLPGFDDQLGLAANYERLVAERLADDLVGKLDSTGEMSLAEVLVHVAAGGRAEYQLAHDRVLMLLTPGYEELSAPLFAFLARELEADRPAWRRAMAAESAAQISVCDPRVLATGEDLPAAEQELVNQLFDALNDLDPIGALSTRQFIFSALGGFASDATVRRLASLERIRDLESERLLMRGAKRTFTLRHAEGKTMPASLLGSWVRRGWSLMTDLELYDTEPVNSGRPWSGGPWGANGEHFTDGRDEVAGLVIEVFIHFAIATLEATGEERAALDQEDLGVIPRRIVEHMLRCYAARVEGLPRPEPCRWIDLIQKELNSRLPSSPPLEGSAALRTLQGGIGTAPVFDKITFLTTMSDQRAFRFENIWDQTTPLKLEEHEVDEPLPTVAWGRMWIESGEPRLAGRARELQWFGGAVQTDMAYAPLGRIEFRAPRRAWLEVTFELPARTDHAVVRIWHHCAGRAPLPFQGRAEARVTLNGSKDVLLPLVGTTRGSVRSFRAWPEATRLDPERPGSVAGLTERAQALSTSVFEDFLAKDKRDDRRFLSYYDELVVPARELVGFDKLTIRYEHADGPNLIWLEGIEVGFGISPVLTTPGETPVEKKIGNL